MPKAIPVSGPNLSFNTPASEELRDGSDTSLVNEKNLPDLDVVLSENHQLEEKNTRLIQKLNERDEEIERLKNRAREAERKAQSYTKESRTMRLYVEMCAALGTKLHIGGLTSQADTEKAFAHLAGLAQVAEAQAKAKGF